MIWNFMKACFGCFWRGGHVWCYDLGDAYDVPIENAKPGDELICRKCGCWIDCE